MIHAQGSEPVPGGARGAWRDEAAAGGVVALLTALGFYAGQQLSFALRLPPAGLTTIWIPGGVLLAAFLLAPPARWWWAGAGALAACLAAFLPVGIPLHIVLAGFVLIVAERATWTR